VNVRKLIFIFVLLASGNLFSQNAAAFTWEEQGDPSTCIQFHSLDTTQANYVWSFNDAPSSQSYFQDPYFCYSDTGCFDVELWVQDIFGNADSTTQTVCIHNSTVVFFPNAFTPNGDGINDVFYVYGYLIPENKFEMRIYDYWGGLIFSSFEVYKGWSGAVEGAGRVSPTGYYLVELIWFDTENQKHTHRGAVLLLK
jgi:gliding motility-associated-like protein